MLKTYSMWQIHNSLSGEVKHRRTYHEVHWCLSGFPFCRHTYSPLWSHFGSLKQLSMAPVNHIFFFLDIRNMSWTHSGSLFILLLFHKKIIFLLAWQKEFVPLNFWRSLAFHWDVANVNTGLLLILVKCLVHQYTRLLW